MFDGMICENLLYGCMDVMEVELFDVVCCVYVDEFVEWLLVGYDLVIGECGVKLLGG